MGSSNSSTKELNIYFCCKFQVYVCIAVKGMASGEFWGEPGVARIHPTAKIPAVAGRYLIGSRILGEFFQARSFARVIQTCHGICSTIA